MIIGIYGRSNSGKTTLIEALVKELSRGYSVATVKHIHQEGFSIDAEGKDTWRHAKAGAKVVVAAGGDETAIMLKKGLPLHKIKEYLDTDIIIVEGFKEDQVQKIAVGDIEELPGTVLRYDGDLSTVVTHIQKEVEVERVYDGLVGLDCGKCGHTCIDMARLIVKGDRKLEDCAARNQGLVTMKVNGAKLELSGFPEDVVQKVVRGLASSLKGGAEAKEVEIRVIVPDEP